MSDKRMVHIIDDEDTVRRSTSFILKTSGFAVETWSSGIAFLKDVRHATHGCVLLDIRMPQMDGLEVQRQLMERGVTMPLIVMTGHGDVSIAVRAMKAGAVDFIEKPFERAVLMAAINAAFDRIERAGAALAQMEEATIVIGALTAREREVLEGLAGGLPNKTIGYDLGISPRTVEVHRANIMTKLGAKSLSDALRTAFAAGFGAA